MRKTAGSGFDRQRIPGAQRLGSIEPDIPARSGGDEFRRKICYLASGQRKSGKLERWLGRDENLQLRFLPGLQAEHKPVGPDDLLEIGQQALREIPKVAATTMGGAITK